MDKSPLVFLLLLEHVGVILFVGHVRRLLRLQLSLRRLGLLLLLHLLLVFFVVLLILANDALLLLDVGILLLAGPASWLIVVAIVVPLKAVLHRVWPRLVRIELESLVVIRKLLDFHFSLRRFRRLDYLTGIRSVPILRRFARRRRWLELLKLFVLRLSGVIR